MFGIKEKVKKCIIKYKGVKFGNNVNFGKNINFGSEPYLIKIGNNVRISSNVNFITHDGGVWVIRNLISDEKNMDFFGKIEIKDNVNIGMNVSIMPGVTIGENSVIGFGAIVTKDVPNNCVYAGIPAKYIESIEEYIEKKKRKCDYTKKYNKKEKRKYLIEKYE